jgi:hypothetical protein
VCSESRRLSSRIELLSDRRRMGLDEIMLPVHDCDR